MSKIYKGPAKIRKDSQEKERCVILGEYIIKTNGTVREAAAQFGISKSTVHKDVTEKAAGNGSHIIWRSEKSACPE